MTAISDSGTGAREARSAIEQVRYWYHSIEVAPGVVTPGWFDLRSTVDQLPWPDVRGRRCLDVGTSDGFLAFELERRGAAEVVATDIGGHEQWDWEPAKRANAERYLRSVAGPDKSVAFRCARELLGSSVALELISVYDLRPDTIGEFDVVVCGSLLLHLRDPLRALAAIRSVCKERLLCTNQIDLGRSLLHPREPLIRLDGTSGETQWWVPNAAGHRQMLRAAGFQLERESRLYSIDFGIGHPSHGRSWMRNQGSIVRRAFTGRDGVPHHAVLARPA